MVKFYIRKKDEEDIFTITLNKEQLDDTRNHFPFLKDGDYFILTNDEQKNL